ncbi:bifunctional (p)ppGpp synthetase/guanosine-3',5'-bis(diphosphate) 3'-pyrophosphohydrolase [Xanthomonas hyacinthi]|uniref:Bifunctional (P)ppGpp synthetase/guanosine-3',5'-bis(Diphosphate) 3'-pyrophosphohydrolase n=1 Tax=Xanthomonas hyacinthi TaxID=56455 RepID=A0A2S7F2Y8_9XANT|nr:HD domain-containing protein [Xanthomonas hyacinthi]KLD77386.1 guanosine polyphosphate pyrophosphohydrolase [Xanthomonas hyacinthi DSM 19077]PPU99806.1 bifunctional (p)ppGpp synthetase/guanosine-3',5'-bis(diphosphate) 3'-pyrophosphohydrolase [Xanthomonas hyacinthi]QGY75962.1 bifunctional (p)ppGpp synthetase/guanosine-3',5'-bis(diphosphate) 3'-pyrophosphohydrolase [Xanthomonas hyacinthi]
MTALTERYARAVDYARVAHAGQFRKGGTVPYFSHVLGVSTLVLEAGGDEDQAIAALLHDVIEDCGAGHEAVIRAQFGDPVAAIVMGCTDASAERKAAQDDVPARRRDWRIRKQAYLAHLSEAPAAVLLVSACDKLYNARSIVADLEDPEVGAEVFERFTVGREGTLWYYAALHAVFAERGVAVLRALTAAVMRMHALAGEAFAADDAGRLALPSLT